MTSSPLLTKQQLEVALRALAGALCDRQLAGKIYLFGGGALVLGFDARDATRDLDGRIDQHHGAVHDAAVEIADRLNLPRYWLNEGGSSFLPRGDDAEALVVYRDAWLTVHAASAPVLLAMKARAQRAQDVADTVFLAELLGLTTAAQIEAVHDQHFPDIPLAEEDRSRLAAIADILAQGTDASEGLGQVIERARDRRRSH